MGRKNSEKKNEEFESIYKACKDAVFKTCLMILRDYQLAEDAAQETFYRVFCRLHTFKRRADINTWITKIAINSCNDILRKERSNKNKAEKAQQSLTYGGDPKSDCKLTLTSAIMSLPDELRTATVLYYYKGFTQKEIAKILKIPQTTVAYRIKMVKEILREKLGEDFYE